MKYEYNDLYDFHDSYGKSIRIGDTLVAEDGRIFEVDENLLKDSISYIAGFKPIYGIRNGRNDNGTLDISLGLDVKEQCFDGFPVIVEYVKLKVE